MEKNITIELTNKKHMLEISKALANEARLEILRLLSYESLSVNEISDKLCSPLTTVASNIQILENANLIRTRLQSGKRGMMKLCSIVYETINFNMINPVLNGDEKDQVITYIPIGNYFSFDVKPTCGLVGEKGFLARDDDPSSFTSSKRFEAQLIWFHEGYLEYRVPINPKKKIKEINLSMELCSEAPYFRNVWPSDITILFNDVDIGTWKCPGDFGGRRGKFTPEWWSISSTQFGLLKNWKVDKTGSTIDYVSLSDVTVDKIFAKSKNVFVSIKIMIKSDAKNVGGINIFGEKFGDYAQGIIFKVTYE